MPPGRGGRLWLAERMETAERAVDLLRQKERVLRREQRRLDVLARRSIGDWRAACADASTWLARATALRGRRVVGLVDHPGDAEADLEWRNSMGAFYPAAARCVLPSELPVADLTGSTAMAEAARASRHALECAVQEAAVRRAVDEVTRELAATARRLQMLDRHWVPALEAAMHELDAQLEEREREDILHARWAHRKREGAR